MKRAAVVVATLSALTVCRVALAGGTEDEARKAFQEGLADEQNGQVTACAKFRRSLELIREIGPLKKVKECDVRESKLLLARAKLTELLARWPRDDAEKAGFATELAAVQARVAHLRLVLRSGAPAGVTVRVDAKPTELPANDLELDPGEHEILVEVPGQPLARTVVTLADGEHGEVALPAEKAATPPGPGRPPAGAPPVAGDSGLSGLGIAGIVVGSVGVAGLIGGAVTGGLVLSDQGAFEDCRDRATPSGCDSAALKDEGDTMLAVNGALFIAGGVVTAIGATLLVVDLVSGPSEGASPTATLGVGPARLDLTLRF